MKKIAILILLTASLTACATHLSAQSLPTESVITQKAIKNGQVRRHGFLVDMYQDDFFPDFLVDKCKAILVELCLEIESQKPKNLKELYVLTHAATGKLNGLGEEFYRNGSELETAARESIGGEFGFIAEVYGFKADTEELMANREW